MYVIISCLLAFCKIREREYHDKSMLLCNIKYT